VRVSEAWRPDHPDAHVGCLWLSRVRNPLNAAPLAAHLAELERQLRQRHQGLDRAGLASLPTMRAYQSYYRSFGQTYHLLGQLESVVLKGRPLVSHGGVLVTAMFAAEIDGLLLTAGHDADVVVEPLELDSSGEGERFVGLGGREHVLKEGDMIMRDDEGIISAVLSGPDDRTQLRSSTTRALFVTYAPVGISVADLQAHLRSIARLVKLAVPAAQTESLEIYPAPD
jgi:DNA/RNA-binding domain of Phe-tRNA-synthetase-like protein